MAATTFTIRSSSGETRLPSLLVIEGDARRTVQVVRLPFEVGRKADKDLVFADPRVSRDHATFVVEENEYFLVDQKSRHGTYVNGNKISRQKLQRDDKIEFGVRDNMHVIFDPRPASGSSASLLLSQIASFKGNSSNDSTDLAKLTLFLDAARRLNSSGVLDEIIHTLIEATLRLTGAERGFVFLKQADGTLRIAAGMNAKSEEISDDATISQSILQDAMRANAAFMLTDTSQSGDMAMRQSVVAFDLRTVICIPLRGSSGSEVIGALYMDARYRARDFSTVSRDILQTIATEAAGLLEKARLVEAEEASRRAEQELSIAASIQQGLLTVNVPDVPFATLKARNFACKQVGGDFYDVVATPQSLGFVLADVSGKGVSAALLASTLQGMFFSHLKTGVPLCETLSTINSFLCAKSLSAKYATAVLVDLRADGEMEFVNCGHVAPVMVMNGKVLRPSEGCMPVGLIPTAEYTSMKLQLQPGDRMIIVTDGVTEAENVAGDFFDNLRLEEVVERGGSLEDILAAVDEFRGDHALTDDCTIIEVVYTGAGA